LGRGRIPSRNDIDAEQFHRSFDDKLLEYVPPLLFTRRSAGTTLRTFQPVSVEESVAAVRALPDNSCARLAADQTVKSCHRRHLAGLDLSV
jgi:hypothetical protein